MSLPAAITLYALLAGIVFLAFGMQRTTLLLAREVDAPSDATAILLPMWFPVVWLPRLAQWALLVYIGSNWSWWLAISLWIASVGLSAFLPIPHKAYFPAFRKRLGQVRLANPETADALQHVLDTSTLTK